MTSREPRPDALIIGAPKAGTSALHAALARHPQIFASPVKEPKYYMCADAPPPAYRGPGDAHSQQEWVWRRPRLRGAVRRRPARVRTPGEHPLLPLPPRGPAPDRRGAARRQADRDRPRPDRPGLLELDAPVGGRAGARAGLRGRLAGRDGPDRCRLGAVLALPPDGPLRRAAQRPVLPVRPRPGAGAALLAAGVQAGGDAQPGGPLPRDRRGPDRHDPAGQLPRLRRAGLAYAGPGPGAAGRGVGRQPAPAALLASGEPAAADRPAARRTSAPTQAAPRPTPRAARGVLRRHRRAGRPARRVLRRLAREAGRGSFKERAGTTG